MIPMDFLLFFFFFRYKFYFIFYLFIFLLYNTVLVLPYIDIFNLLRIRGDFKRNSSDFFKNVFLILFYLSQVEDVY